MNAGRQVNIMFAKGRDIESWSQRHAEGVVPDEWPYGLDGLSKHYPMVAALEVQHIRPSRLARALIAQRKKRVIRDKATVSLSWEEDLALRTLEQFPTNFALSGVIWATDAVASRRARLKRGLTRWALRRMDLVWTLSEPQVEIVKDWLGPGGPHVRYLRFGVDHEFYQEQPFPDRPMLFSAGGDRDRDPTTLFRALEIVRRERPGVEVVVQSKTEIPSPDGVRVIPYLTHVQLREAYRRATVVAIATRPNQHASGMTVALEAMAVGRPVVITETPGLGDYVRHGDTGILVGTGDYLAMAKEAIALIDDQAEAAAMGKRARARVVKSFTSARMADDLAAFVSDVMTERR